MTPVLVDNETRCLRPGDVVEWRSDRFPEVAVRWRVHGVYLGGLGQEGIVEIESLSERPGSVDLLMGHISMPLLYVPEPLLRGLLIVDEVQP